MLRSMLRGINKCVSRKYVNRYDKYFVASIWRQFRWKVFWHKILRSKAYSGMWINPRVIHMSFMRLSLMHLSLLRTQILTNDARSSVLFHFGLTWWRGYVAISRSWHWPCDWWFGGVTVQWSEVGRVSWFWPYEDNENNKEGRWHGGSPAVPWIMLFCLQSMQSMSSFMILSFFIWLDKASVVNHRSGFARQLADPFEFEV